MWYCKKCKKKNDGRFCTYCGGTCIETENSAEETVAAATPAEPAAASSVSPEPIEHSAIPREEPLESEDTKKSTETEKIAAANGAFSAAALFRRGCESGDASADGVKATEKNAAAQTVDASAESLQTASEAADTSLNSEEKESAPETEKASPAAAAETQDPGATEENAELTFAAVPYSEDDDGMPSPFRRNSEESVALGEHALFRSVKYGNREENEEAETEDGEESTAKATKAPAHRKPKETPADREMRVGKWIVLIGGIVAGIILIVFVSLLTSLLSGKDRNGDEEAALPQGTDTYYYVSGVESFAGLYQDNSIASEVLAQLNNGDPVELIHEENYKFVYVLDHESGEYGYVLLADLVDDRAKIEFTKEEEAINAASEPEDKTVIDDYYVTDTKNHLPVHAKASTASASRGKLNNGDKVGLVQMTSDDFWYVYAYDADVYGYVSVSYLTQEKPAAEKDEAESE